MTATERIARYRSRHIIRVALGPASPVAEPVCETDGIRVRAIRGGLRHDVTEIRALAAEAIREESEAAVAPKVIPAGTADWGPVGESDAGVVPNLGSAAETARLREALQKVVDAPVGSAANWLRDVARQALGDRP